MPTDHADGKRTRYAGQDFLTRNPEGARYRLRIDTVGHKPGWQPRIAGDQIHPEHPGTAIHFEDGFWEVVAETPSSVPGAAPRTLYHLNPWEDRFPLRVTLNYDRDAAERHAVEHVERERGLERGRWLNALSPLVGMLPAADQERIEARYGVPADRATVLSAVFVLVLCSVAVTLTLRSGSPAWIPVAIAAALLSTESVYRLFKAQGPCGQFVIAGPIVAARLVREAFATGTGLAPPDRLPLDASLLNARDDVRRLDDGNLEVVSRLGKPHWLRGGAIRHEGVVYRLVSDAPVEVGGQPRHRFVLRPDPGDSLITGMVEYDPTEVRDVYIAGKRARYDAWIHTLYAAWGLLPPATQERLALIYRYDPTVAIGSSIFATRLAGGVATVTAIYHLVRPDPHGSDGIVLAIGVALLVDAGRRARGLNAGKLVGSPLGIVLGPFASRMLR